MSLLVLALLCATQILHAEIGVFRRIIDQSLCPENFFAHFAVNTDRKRFVNLCPSTATVFCNPQFVQNFTCLEMINSDNTLQMQNDWILLEPHLEFINEFTIVFVGYVTNPNNIRNIVLGPGGHTGNCQIRYQSDNTFGVDSITDIGDSIGPFSYIKDTTSISYIKENIKLPYDVTKMHTIEIYYSNQQLSIYQNYQHVTTINGLFGAQFGEFGGWFTGKYLADIAIHDIIFTSVSQNVPLFQQQLKHLLSDANVTIVSKPY
eukprot:409450_1